MKKATLFLCVLTMLFSLCACGTRAGGGADTTVNAPSTEPLPSTAEQSSASSEAPAENAQVETVRLPLEDEYAEFSFLSGAGAWRTVLTLSRDGAFEGFYLDSEMGEIGDDYPNGSAYVCDFHGIFENIEKINEYSYKMTLTTLKTEQTVGEEWIEEEIRYVASEAYGLVDTINGQDCTEFILYLPDTPIDELPEDFLFWWPYRYSQETEPKTTLSCYGILNVTTNDGFFTVQ